MIPVTPCGSEIICVCVWILWDINESDKESYIASELFWDHSNHNNMLYSKGPWSPWKLCIYSVYLFNIHATWDIAECTIFESEPDLAQGRGMSNT